LIGSGVQQPAIDRAAIKQNDTLKTLLIPVSFLNYLISETVTRQ
jgi:hypothetical protein